MKRYVLDTNTLVENPDLLKEYNLENEEIIIPMVVLEEIDKMKSGTDMLAFNARQLIRNLEDLGDKITYPRLEGVKRQNKTNDDLILNIAKNENAILVTNDKILRIKAVNDKVGYESPRISREMSEKMYSGFVEVSVAGAIIDQLYAEGSLLLDEVSDSTLYKNQYVLLKNGKQSALAKVKGGTVRLVSTSLEDTKVFGIKARNVEQLICLDSLLDPDIPVVSLVGLAGSGKTLLALAAGMQQIFNRNAEPKRYKRIIVTRPIQVVGKDIGYLPGTMEEKMEKWIGPIYDNLEHLTGNDYHRIEGWFEKGKIAVEAMAYIRGRSISDSFIIVDECQNISPHEIKTILTRVGENTKIVLTGDIEQIDNPKLNRFSNGLTYMIERFKNQSISAHVSLTKGERSEVATVAAEIL